MDLSPVYKYLAELEEIEDLSKRLRDKQPDMSYVLSYVVITGEVDLADCGGEGNGRDRVVDTVVCRVKAGRGDIVLMDMGFCVFAQLSSSRGSM